VTVSTYLVQLYTISNKANLQTNRNVNELKVLTRTGQSLNGFGGQFCNLWTSLMTKTMQLLIYIRCKFDIGYYNRFFFH